MKWKKYLLWGAGLFAIYAVYVTVSLFFLPPVTALKDKKTNMTIQVKDWQGNYHPLVVGPKNRYWAPLSQIPSEMKWAVILAEDASFYKHEGIDVKAIKEAIKYDLEKQSFARGASTITQQVAKNLFLSREKTLTRKAKEVYLAKRMEQELTKGRIIELYLNVIELGPMVHGIGHGARYYFGKSPAALTPRECAFLAAMLPGPRVAYNPYKNLDKVLKRSNMILRLLANKGVLSSGEYQAALAEMPNIGRMQRKVDESIKQVEVMANRTSATVPQGLGAQPEQGPAAPAAGAPVEQPAGTEAAPEKAPDSGAAPKEAPALQDKP
ncbi:transglycosylase domain-containing protein [Geomonas oryzisoli]|uniref:Transglycosylase domain-containing protein n=1 Tax=Geomonas oryzisoli TaxID=2847992 RepID=A0ABX8J8Z5_9BACT|nr:biosynthetic peptidoglycan transglycosylase [Geomonas oryzisoli]QWV93581.1 transglycosylase domain-containing protein [Geomonas oryzisoli]